MTAEDFIKVLKGNIKNFKENKIPVSLETWEEIINQLDEVRKKHPEITLADYKLKELENKYDRALKLWETRSIYFLERVKTINTIFDILIRSCILTYGGASATLMAFMGYLATQKYPFISFTIPLSYFLFSILLLLFAIAVVIFRSI